MVSVLLSVSCVVGVLGLVVVSVWVWLIVVVVLFDVMSVWIMLSM